MKVLLRSDIKGVGRRGDIVNVSSGHARNFLLPNDLAIVANAGTIAQAEVMRKSRELQIAADRESARLVAASLSTTVIKIAAKAGNEGRLFGSVNAAEIAKAVLDQTGVTIDRKSIQVETPLRQLGEHSVSAEIFSEVVATLKLEIVAK
ncbi:MAG: 50S ribosomal protein L9 [Actinobacteria bacterium]|nr:50S ribosomal protein L9 [Actinomycetota bacterium]NCU80401.1 50S ribosomal protein L9 [Acidimicrobiia bacterium]NBQ03834.1 50S ribosomal protein L9 [Actinomycetota bacterium]NBQ44963.1 50S ribosomal protein L9 [Actinomycetota bacterium]NCW83347.1 50S ribosomal protein L9 [Acidimicrobiia bacterium]